jgi:hypothetical protein
MMNGDIAMLNNQMVDVFPTETVAFPHFFRG